MSTTDTGHYGAGMLAAYAVSQSADDPLSGLVVGERPDPQARPGWTVVDLRAAALNHHDLWSLRGVGLAQDRLPMILGCDGAGRGRGRQRGHRPRRGPATGWRGDETLDPRRTLLSERTRARSPRRSSCRAGNLVPKPEALSLEDGRLPADGVAHGVPDALHPGRRSARRHRARPGRRRWRRHRADRSSARPRATGCGRPAATRRKGARALEIGADRAFESRRAAARAGRRRHGDRRRGRPGRTRSTSLRPGGTIVISGATSGDAPAKAELTRIFFLQLRVVGSTMGTRDELASWLALRRAAPASSRSVDSVDAAGPRPATGSRRWPTATSSARSSSPIG